MAVEIYQGRTIINSYYNEIVCNADLLEIDFNAKLLELLQLPNLDSCSAITLFGGTTLRLETVVAMFETSLAKTLKTLSCFEIYFSPETLEQLLKFELTSLSLLGGYSTDDWNGVSYVYPTLEPEHIAILQSHPRVGQLKHLSLLHQNLELSNIKIGIWSF